MLILVAGMASACSSMHDYTNSKPENMSITPDVRKGSALMHVYDVDNKCDLHYQGTVELSGAKLKVGIPVSKLSYLEFIFSDTSIFTGSHSTSYGMYLTPRSGNQYDATVNYIDGMYYAKIHEQDSRGGTRHEVQRTVPKPCLKVNAGDKQ